MSKLKFVKGVLRSFIREHYTDQKLTEVLAHAQDGKLAYLSCCCFIGVVTATHALKGEEKHMNADHYLAARELHGSVQAEFAYAHLGQGADSYEEQDPLRRKRLIPLLRAEMKRREKLRTNTLQLVEAN
jgi:hypothetical protein